MSSPDGPVFLQTGDEELDKLLSADPQHEEESKATGKSKRNGGKAEKDDKAQRGLRVGRMVKSELRDTPVVLIKGTPGTGKTTLVLQIADHVAMHGVSGPWKVIFLNLEQPMRSLLDVVRAFGFLEKNFEDRSQVPPPSPTRKKRKKKEYKGRVLLCNLSPLPVADQETDKIFEVRFAELQNMIEKVTAGKDFRTICIIDSMSAMTGSQLTRSQIHRLFSLFRSQNIPLIVTLEHSEMREPTEEFLADIVLELSRNERDPAYMQFALEVSKSRVCRQGLGKHLYKIRTKQNAEDVGSSRQGIVVYPSVHFIISQARRAPAPERKFEIAKELKELVIDEPIKTPACFALMGPHGTHKLAVGLNLSISYVRKHARLLVVMFGGQGEIDFKDLAWVEHQSYLRDLDRTAPASSEAQGTKSQMLRYEAEAKDAPFSAVVTVLTFQIGVLTPEECLYKINQVLEDEALGGFDSILLSDTAELCTGFPMLSKDPMFFAALLDLFESRNLMTVGIGVLSTNEPSLREINLTLMAKATHRMQFHHFPLVEDLMSGMVRRVKCTSKEDHLAIDKKKPLPKEQLVSVVTDNVIGKHYMRTPKWIRVKEYRGKKRRTLYFKRFDEPEPDWMVGPTASNSKAKASRRRTIRRAGG